MSGLFSCCGYDTVSDKDATLNVSVMSQTSPVAGRPVGDLLMHGGTQPNGHTDLSEDKVFVNGKITAANSRSTDQGGGDAEAGERRGVTVEQGQEEGSGGTGDSKSRLGDREEYMNDGGSSLIALTAELKEKEKLRLQVLVSLLVGTMKLWYVSVFVVVRRYWPVCFVACGFLCLCVLLSASASTALRSCLERLCGLHQWLASCYIA
eukprot:GHVQ01023955.1.p1 GENE.GHVQ01023955.1~~GHVQ01023955.1.p1  ORF type:complete len:207 (+),score=37.64 GHVQ01023955.1:731-1351(+)